MTTDLLELAARCEASTGPDRGLDALITIALAPERQTIIGQKPGRFPQEPIYGPITEFVAMAEANGADAAQYLNAPAYTASLDAAMTLVPEGVTWTLGAGGDEPTIATISAGIGRPDAVHGFCATPALALCAAALRARAQTGEG